MEFGESEKLGFAEIEKTQKLVCVYQSLALCSSAAIRNAALRLCLSDQ